MELPRRCVICSTLVSAARLKRNSYTCSRACTVKRANWRRSKRALRVGPRSCANCQGPIDPELRKGTKFCQKRCQGAWFQRLYWRRKHPGFVSRVA